MTLVNFFTELIATDNRMTTLSHLYISTDASELADAF